MINETEFECCSNAVRKKDADLFPKRVRPFSKKMPTSFKNRSTRTFLRKCANDQLFIFQRPVCRGNTTRGIIYIRELIADRILGSLYVMSQILQLCHT